MIFDHPALLYRDADEYLAGTVPFVTEGLAAGEPVAVSVPPENLALLSAALGPDVDRIVRYDMTVVGRNPGRILPTVLLAFADLHPDRRVRIIGEPIWATRSAVEYPACVQHEALINTAFAGRNAAILCPYDTARLDPAWLAHAERTHPTMGTGRTRWASPRYGDPVAVAGDFNAPLPDPPPDAERMTVERDALPKIRRFVAETGRRVGLSTHRVDDLTMAVNELAGNTIDHTDGPGELALWVADGYVVAQVRDGGYIADPMAGRIPVPPDAPGRGRGLLLVQHVCDLVRIHTTPAGTTIRIQLLRDR